MWPAGAGRIGVWLIAAAGAFSGCAERPADPALLARVGQVRIEGKQLAEFEARLPAGDRATGPAPDAHRAALQQLIDREVLLLEARAEGLESDERIRQRLETRETTRLAGEMMQRQVLDSCAVSQAEIQAAYDQAGWDEQVVSHEIFVTDQEKAREVQELLDQGVAFAEVARQCSVDRLLKVPIGVSQQVTYSPFDGPREVVDAVFGLPAGGITAPVPNMGGYVIARVAERRKVELEKLRERIEKVLKEAKGKSRLEEYLRRLKTELQLTFQPQGMELALAALRQRQPADSLSAEQGRTPVYTFAGAVVDVEEVVRRVGPAADRWPQAAEGRVNGFMQSTILPEKVMAADARRQGVEQTPSWQEWRQKELENYTLVRLRDKALAGRQAPTEEEERAAYEQQRQRFRIPVQARVQELLVEDAELARQLAARCAAGEELAGLIARYGGSQASGDGSRWVLTSRVPLYGEAWMNAVMNAPIGAVQGPVATRNQYSVFRVLERQAESFYPLENPRVKSAIAREVREHKELVLFNQYMEDLRGKYASRIEVFDENLEKWTAAAAGEEREP